VFATAAVLTILIVLALQKFSLSDKRLSPQESLASSTRIEPITPGASLAVDREPSFFESFSDSDKSVLFEKGWELIDHDDALWNRPDKTGAYINIGEIQFIMKSQYVALAAFQGISQAMPDGSLRQLTWEPVPAHFDFVKVEPVE